MREEKRVSSCGKAEPELGRKKETRLQEGAWILGGRGGKGECRAVGLAGRPRSPRRGPRRCIRAGGRVIRTIKAIGCLADRGKEMAGLIKIIISSITIINWKPKSNGLYENYKIF